MCPTLVLGDDVSLHLHLGFLNGGNLRLSEEHMVEFIFSPVGDVDDCPVRWEVLYYVYGHDYCSVGE